MQIRIFTIRGRTESARGERLARLRGWMEEHGWLMVDLSDEGGSVVFERPEEAARLRPLHPTLWLPGPDWFHPREWLATLLTIPRQTVIVGGAGLLVSLAFVALLAVSHSSAPPDGPGAAPGQASTESWQFVKSDALNLRVSPDDKAQIVGVLYRNQRVEVTERKEGWARIVRPERGYVSMEFLQDYPVE